ncbi:MAG: hypothetical protein ABIJ21_08995 [Nanoarchaeota archaeon]
MNHTDDLFAKNLEELLTNIPISNWEQKISTHYSARAERNEFDCTDYHVYRALFDNYTLTLRGECNYWTYQAEYDVDQYGPKSSFKRVTISLKTDKQILLENHPASTSTESFFNQLIIDYTRFHEELAQKIKKEKKEARERVLQEGREKSLQKLRNRVRQ